MIVQITQRLHTAGSVHLANQACDSGEAAEHQICIARTAAVTRLLLSRPWSDQYGKTDAAKPLEDTGRDEMLHLMSPSIITDKVDTAVIDGKSVTATVLHDQIMVYDIQCTH